MENFTFYTPTRVVFGRGAESQVGSLLKSDGATRVLIHYGSDSVRRSGLLDRVRTLVADAGIAFCELGGVVPNPRLSKIREGIALGHRENVDYILGVGGGSVIDSAKGIALGLACACDVWDLYLRKQAAERALPVACILTLSATGTEMSWASVVTNEDGRLKRSVNSDCIRPRFSILNPELTMTLPDYQTACGCTDILMHTMERYFSPVSTMELTDSMAEALMRTVIANARILRRDPMNYDARAEIMWAGSLSHNGLTGCGGAGDWASHQLQHELSAMFDVAHGAGLAAVWGSWARYVFRHNPARFARYAENVMDVSPAGDDGETALLGIEAVERLFDELGMPTCIRSLGCNPSDEQVRELAYRCSYFGTRTIGGFMKLDRADMERIYRLAL